MVSGGLGGLVTALLVQHGLDAVTSAIVGAFAVGVITRGLRYLRGTKWAAIVNILYPEDSSTTTITATTTTP